MIMRVSSAYWIIGKVDEHCRFKGLCNNSFCIETFTKTVTHMLPEKRRGERGSPRMPPILHLKVHPAISFKRTTEVAH
jgi:hypothetical protein